VLLQLTLQGTKFQEQKPFYFY